MSWMVPTVEELGEMSPEARLKVRDLIKEHLTTAELQRAGFKAGTYTPAGDADTFLIRNGSFIRRCQGALAQVNSLIHQDNQGHIPSYPKSALDHLLAALRDFINDDTDEHFDRLVDAYEPFIPQEATA